MDGIYPCRTSNPAGRRTMTDYIITEEELLDTRSYIYHEDEVAFSRIESKVRSHPYQSERDKVLNNKLASR